MACKYLKFRSDFDISVYRGFDTTRPFFVPYKSGALCEPKNGECPKKRNPLTVTANCWRYKQ